MRKSITIVMTMLMLMGMIFLSGCGAKYYMPISEVSNPRVVKEITTTYTANFFPVGNIIGYPGIGMAGVGGYMMGTGEVGTGAAVAGSGLALALVGDLINAPGRKRVLRDGYEALLTKARQEHYFEVDVRDVKTRNISGNMYRATGTVIRK